MKSISKANVEFENRGPGERCPVRVKAQITAPDGTTSQFGWHWCSLKKGHPGPHQCVHGEFPGGSLEHIDSHKGPVPLGF